MWGGMCLVVALAAVAVAEMPARAAAQGAAPAMSWQEAVAELAGERTRAEACVSLLKRYAAGNAAALGEGEWAYAEAKADMDGVIAGAGGGAGRGRRRRCPSMACARNSSRRWRCAKTFCAEALALAPPSEGTKSPMTDVLAKALGSLIDAAERDSICTTRRRTSWCARRSRRRSKATRWRSFAEIAS